MAKAKTKKPAITSETAVSLRKKLGISQAQFWNPLGVTQSGGSRYESGRSIPAPVRKLLYLFYHAAIGANVLDEVSGI